jgi:hypothetical protein
LRRHVVGSIGESPFDPRQLARVIERHGVLRKTIDALTGGNAAERVEVPETRFALSP